MSITKKQRTKINDKSIEIINNVPRGLETKEQIEILSQYSGVGGLEVKGYDCKEGIFSQYYTPKNIIDSIYRTLENNNFKPKNILEPSVGSGNFIGSYNDKTIKWDIVDIDKNNTEITRRLYPNQINNVYSDTYETFENSGYDLIVSNIPFIGHSSLPRKHYRTIKPDFKSLHNFYFIHSVEKLNEYGVLVFITSTFISDGKTESKKVREEIIKTCNVLGVFRLPQKSFIDTHTEVSSDIVFLQKRPQNQDPISDTQKKINEDFTKVIRVEGVEINKYLYENKEQSFLGDYTIGKDKTKMGNKGIIISGEPQLDKIDISISKNEQKDLNELNSHRENKFEFKDYEDTLSKTKDKDIKVIDSQSNHTMIIENDTLYRFDKYYKYSENSSGCLLGFKDTSIVSDKIILLNELLNISNDFQNGSDIDTKMVQDKIDTYKNQYTVHPSLDIGLKKYLEKYNQNDLYNQFISLFSKGFNIGKVFIEKVRFLDSIQSKSVKIQNLENLNGIINIVDLDTIISKSEIKELIDNEVYFYINENQIQQHIYFKSGHIRNKIKDLETQLETIKDNKISYNITKGIDILETLKQTTTPYENIFFIGNENWLFSSETIIDTLEENDIVIDYSSNNKLSFNSFNNKLNDYLDYNEISIYEKVLEKKQIITKSQYESQEDFNKRLEESNHNFKEHIVPKIKSYFESMGLLETIEEVYNETFNSIVEPDYSKINIQHIPKTFRGKDLTLLNHQRENIQKNIFNKKGVIGFEPGGGKTITSIISLRELQLKGLVKKTMVVVPSNTIKQWKDTINGLYPDCKVMEFKRYTSGSNKGKEKDWSKLTKVEKKMSLYDMSNNHYDFVVMSYELFQDIKLDEESLTEYIRKYSNEVFGVKKLDIYQRFSDEYSEKEEQKNKRYLEIFKNNMIETSKNSDTPTLDRLGFDSIIVDEIHNFKNIGYSGYISKLNVSDSLGFTEKKNENGQIIDTPIKGFKNYDMKFKLQYISEKTNGNFIFLLSGTPTPKKPIEIYTILTFLDKNILEEYGIESVNDFIDNFFQIEKLPKKRQNGTSKPDNFITGFKNMDILKNIINRYIDFKTFVQMDIKDRPKHNEVIHYIKESKESQLIMNDTKQRLIEIGNLSKEELKDYEDNIISIFNDGRYGSIDSIFYSPSFTFLTLQEKQQIKKINFDKEFSKIGKTIDLVINQRQNKESSGQIIFLDRQTFINEELEEKNIHKIIKEQLVQSGVFKNSEVGICNGKNVTNPKTGQEVGKTTQNLETLIEYYNKGFVKVIIGTTSSLGVGVDLNKFTTDIYNIDLPTKLNSGDLEQRLNRGVRQGNINSSVRVHNFKLPFSYDELLNSIIGKKKGFNDSLWNKQVINNKVDIEQEDTTPDMYDILIELEKDIFRKKTYKIENEYYQSTNQISDIQKIILRYTKDLEIKKRRVEELEYNIEIYTKKINSKDSDEKTKTKLREKIIDSKNKLDTFISKISVLEQDIEKTNIELDKKISWKDNIREQFWCDISYRIDYHKVKNYFNEEDLKKEFGSNNSNIKIYKNSDTHTSNIKPEYLTKIDNNGQFVEVSKSVNTNIVKKKFIMVNGKKFLVKSKSERKVS